MDARLASSVLVGGLIRAAEAEGGFAALLARGDDSAGAVVVILAERGGKPRVMERILQPDGVYKWQDSGGQAADNAEELDKFLTRRRRIDPDAWLLELDIPSIERFAAVMTALD